MYAYVIYNLFLTYCLLQNVTTDMGEVLAHFFEVFGWKIRIAEGWGAEVTIVPQTDHTPYSQLPPEFRSSSALNLFFWSQFVLPKNISFVDLVMDDENCFMNSHARFIFTLKIGSSKPNAKLSIFLSIHDTQKILTPHGLEGENLNKITLYYGKFSVRTNDELMRSILKSCFEKSYLNVDFTFIYSRNGVKNVQRTQKYLTSLIKRGDKVLEHHNLTIIEKGPKTQNTEGEEIIKYRRDRQFSNISQKILTKQSPIVRRRDDKICYIDMLPESVWHQIVYVYVLGRNINGHFNDCKCTRCASRNTLSVNV